MSKQKIKKLIPAPLASIKLPSILSRARDELQTVCSRGRDAVLAVNGLTVRVTPSVPSRTRGYYGPRA